MGKSVYVVMCDHGEYSDYFVWVVAAYADRNLAEEHTKKAAALHEEIRSEFQAALKAWNSERNPTLCLRSLSQSAAQEMRAAWAARVADDPAPKPRPNPYDPEGCPGWNTNRYFVIETPLRKNLP